MCVSQNKKNGEMSFIWKCVIRVFALLGFLLLGVSCSHGFGFEGGSPPSFSSLSFRRRLSFSGIVRFFVAEVQVQEECRLIHREARGNAQGKYGIQYL